MLVSLSNWAVLGIFLTPDTHTYTDPVRGLFEQATYGLLMTSGAYSPTAYRTPGTSLLLLPGYLISQDETMMFFLGTLFFSFLAPFLSLFAFKLGKLYSLSAGIIGYILMLVHANMHFNAVSVMSDLPFAASFALANLLVFKAVEKERPSFLVLLATGMSIGFCILIRPTGMYWFFGLIFLFVFRERRRWVPHLKQATIIITSVACLVAPWVIRNGIVLNTFSLETIKGIALMWSFGDKIEIYGEDSNETKAVKARLLKLSEARFMQYYYNGFDYSLSNEAKVSHILSRVATQHIMKHPAEFSSIWLTNFKNIFFTQIHYDTWLELLKQSPTYRRISYMIVPNIPRFDTKVYHVSLELKRISVYAVYLLLPGLAILLFRNHFIGLLSCWSILCIAGLTAIVSGYDRFRLPLDPIISGTAGICLSTAAHLIIKTGRSIKDAFVSRFTFD